MTNTLLLLLTSDFPTVTMFSPMKFYILLCVFFRNLVMWNISKQLWTVETLYGREEFVLKVTVSVSYTHLDVYKRQGIHSNSGE